MIRPKPPALLEGVAASFEVDVLPWLARGSVARRQLKAGIALLRRVAATWESFAPTLAADSRDIEATLRRIAPELETVAEIPPALANFLAEGELGDGTDGDTVEATNERLQQLLVELQRALAERGPGLSPIERELQALYRRMTERELALARPE